MTAAGPTLRLRPGQGDGQGSRPQPRQGRLHRGHGAQPRREVPLLRPRAHHGSGAKSGVPVVQYEIATGKRKVLAFLHGPAA